MGFLSPAEKIIAQAMSLAMRPPPPVDITRWCEENVIFDERSPMPGPFNIERFAFLREIHEVLSPEHPCREVTIRGSAQWGKTVSILQPTLGAWHASTPLDSLVVHPTKSAATEWVDNKWMPMRRQAPGLRKIFGDGTGGAQRDNNSNQETLTRDGSLKVAGAGSPADLTGTSRRLVIMDDVSKYEMSDMGDPEALAEMRASGFDDAKIVRISTSMIKGTCRITRSYARSDQRLYYVPCPHCGDEAPLTWENFKENIDPQNLEAACFRCEPCGKKIRHKHKEDIVAKGRWVAQNAKGDHPGFHLWRAYAPQRDWASIAIEYSRMMGWSRADVNSDLAEKTSKIVETETEQTFFNDVLGLPFEQASDAPDWEHLKARAEHDEDGVIREDVLPKGIVPSNGVLFTAGVDFQDDRTEVHFKAFGRNRRRWTVDYKVIPHHISEQACMDTLNSLLKQEWRTELGLKIKLDMMAVDGGTYTDDVWSWAKKHPWSRVIIVKGASTQNGPIMLPMKFERRRDGKAKRRQKRGFMLNVSMMKGNFYTWLAQENETERGYCNFCRGLSDDYYKQITSEVKVLSRTRTGVVTASWDLVEPSRRNEGLDTEMYAEAAARRKGWSSMTDDQWDFLEAERGKPGDENQPDLFEKTVAVVPDEKPKKQKLSEILNNG